MEAPPGMTGRFFVAVEPPEKKGGLRIWPKEPLRTTSGTSWTRQPGEADTREKNARRPLLTERGGLAPGESRTTSRTSGPGRKSAASRNSRSAKPGLGSQGAPALLLVLTHPSAWKGDSP